MDDFALTDSSGAWDVARHCQRYIKSRSAPVKVLGAEEWKVNSRLAGGQLSFFFAHNIHRLTFHTKRSNTECLLLMSNCPFAICFLDLTLYYCFYKVICLIARRKRLLNWFLDLEKNALHAQWNSLNMATGVLPPLKFHRVKIWSQKDYENTRHTNNTMGCRICSFRCWSDSSEFQRICRRQWRQGTR